MAPPEGSTASNRPPGVARPREARLKDISLKTGYSINTVSVALRGEPRISEHARRVILAAAQELDYRPNVVARSLVSRSTRTVGVILSNLHNPILTTCAQYIEHRLAEHGYSTVLATTQNDLAKEKQVLETLRARQVEGILIYVISRRHLEHILPLRRAGYPVMLLSGAPTDQIDVVSVDNFDGARRMTQYLLGLGHRRIALLDGGEPHSNLEKRQGYEAALRGSGCEPDQRLIFHPQGSTTAHEGYQAMARIMGDAPRPTAVFASTDSMAIGVLRWCRENKVKVPDDLSVAGFDDIEMSSFLDVPLTTVGYSTEQVGEKAVARLMALMEAEGGLPGPEAEIINPDLVIRGSCRPPRRTLQRGNRESD